MKKSIVMIMALSLALCGTAFAEEGKYDADVNGDGTVSVADATAIQKMIAGMR